MRIQLRTFASQINAQPGKLIALEALNFSQKLLPDGGPHAKQLIAIKEVLSTCGEMVGLLRARLNAHGDDELMDNAVQGVVFVFLSRRVYDILIGENQQYTDENQFFNDVCPTYAVTLCDADGHYTAATRKL